MRNSFLRLALYVLAVLLSVVKPIYDLTRMTLPAACQPFDGAVWLGFAPLIVAVLLIPIAIITERSNNHQSGLIVSLLSIVTIILGFANVYAGSGIQHDDTVATHWMEYVYFSATTFTTLGYGDFVPCPGVRLFTSLEALFGLLYGPLLVGLSVNKFLSLRARR
ncbi:potassium channel family protein [Acuticoccus sp. I52.16.1]|uniref:potassium channel family protein n=1 Tax=Acuticoccus sp. I52.16.1 TaxID=2928472 RepID=UPI001FCFB264|nr:potassium channel family protein [Acuticoccus sp. I52.16.1]UOM35891.1 ion channel [Acuticoccus sp. I52.16.1]